MTALDRDSFSKTDSSSEGIVHSSKSKYPNGLYLVATPIGNLEDITLRALHLFKTADLVVCEDTRVTGKLLSYYGIKTPMQSYHENNAARIRPVLLKKLEQGQTLAFCSDAGTPLISDPGFKLVQEAIEHEIYLTSLPGACAFVTALTVSGICREHFLFAGFPPPKQQARLNFYESFLKMSCPLIFYESPKRLIGSLQDLHSVFGERSCAVSRELTKRFEETKRGTIPELIQWFTDNPVKGEIVITLDQSMDDSYSTDDIDRFLHKELETESLKDAVKAVKEQTGWSKKAVYERALFIKQGCYEE